MYLPKMVRLNLIDFLHEAGTKKDGATNDQNASVDQKPPVEQQLHSGESEEAMVITRGMERRSKCY